WVFLWQKGYQETDSVVSSVTTKVKGVTLTNTSTLGTRIWDVAYYVIPPQGENTVFVMTNVILTLNQSQGCCPEFPDDKTECTVKSSCVPGYVSTQSNGIQTGECVPYNSHIKTCEVFAWCPVEDDSHVPKPAFLREAENFTLLVKNDIWYHKFNLSNGTTPYQSFLFSSTLFSASSWLSQPGGRVSLILLICSHPFSLSFACGPPCAEKPLCAGPSHAAAPSPALSRLPGPLQPPAHLSPLTYLFSRFAKYYNNSDDTESWMLVKAYGIYFHIIVFGKAGKFDVIPTMINIGSGLALFGVATVLCDIVVLYCMKKRYYYREKKYKYVEDYELVSINE
ncbi:P2RX4 protein, partial [Calyptomena viridis]|nr:P2RX4 protein [Calyptomena viridis]